MDRSIRALQRRDPNRGDRVALAAGYLRRGLAQAALDALGTEPPGSAEAVEVHARAWAQLLGGLRKVRPYRVAGRMAVLGVAAGDWVLRAATPGGQRAWWPLDPSGERPLSAGIRGPMTPLLCAPAGLLMALSPLPSPVWMRPPEWQFEPTERGAWGVEGLGDVSPDGTQAAWPQGVFSLPNLELVAPPPPNAGDGWVMAWASELAVWADGPRVCFQPLGGGELGTWEPREVWRRRHPAEAASQPPGETASEVTVLRDGRLCATAPLAVHDPRSGATWFPNRGDARGLSGRPRLSLDGQALLLFRGARPCRVPLEGRLPPLATPVGEPGLWHPRSACALVREAAHAPARLRDVHGQTLFSFPHALRPVCWTPDGRGVLFQRELGAGSGPLELWRIPEAA